MEQLHCSIVEDLLPSYVEHLTHAYTSEAVEHHLESCPGCRQMLDDIRPKGDEVHPQEIQRFSRFLKKVKIRNWIIGALVTAACLLAIWGVGLFLSAGIFPVSASEIEISQLCQLENGKVAFRLGSRVSAETSGITTELEVNDAGELCMVIEEKASLLSTHHEQVLQPDSYFSFSVKDVQDGKDIAKIYYRGNTADDVKVIWEEGMQLPKANAEMQQYDEALHTTGQEAVESAQA